MGNFSKETGMDPRIVQSFTYQLLKGIAHCHERKILHRDLKPQNLLISKKNILKLADFGLARASGIPVKGFTHEVVTLWYRPPDVLLGSQKYTSAIDIWSVGCIFAEMVNMRPLFPGQKEGDELKRIFKAVGTPNNQNWPGVEDLPQWKNWKGTEFDDYEGQPLSDLVPRLGKDGLDLLEVLQSICRKCCSRTPVSESQPKTPWNIPTLTIYPRRCFRSTSDCVVLFVLLSRFLITV